MSAPLERRRTDTPQLSWTCPSCGATPTTRYCGDCGEQCVPGFAQVTDGDITSGPKRSFVGRLRASLGALASPPGQLTADWIRGRRVGYLAPLSLFLWINVAFFLVQAASGLGVLTWPLRAHLSDETINWITMRLLAQHRPDMPVVTDAYANVFNALESVHAKSLVIVMVPAFAAVLGVLLIDRRHGFKDSLTFATHFFAFSLIWLCALFPTVAIVLYLIAASGISVSSLDSTDLAITGLEVTGLAWYLYVALGTVFGMAMLRRLLSVIALVAALAVILKAYHVVVFAVTLYST
jgi:Protein of unknown function (DUF3667)